MTLSLWARREDGLQRHLEAVAAYREALKELTFERAPQDWADILNNLGTELAFIGEAERDTATLQDAVAAHRESMRVQTWATSCASKR